MKVKRYLSVVALATLTACGSTVSNTDKPTGIYIAGATEASGDFGVTVATQRPNNGKTISGVSCKNKLWEPSPTNEAAISVLKRETAKAGYNRVYIKSVKQDPSALAKNCWSAIIAEGIGFSSN
jgi:hypothetical protein